MRILEAICFHISRFFSDLVSELFLIHQVVKQNSTVPFLKGTYHRIAYSLIYFLFTHSRYPLINPLLVHNLALNDLQLIK